MNSSIRNITLTLLLFPFYLFAQDGGTASGSDESIVVLDQYTGADMTAHARASIAQLRRKASVEHKPAIQVGVIYGSVSNRIRDDEWYGNVKVDVKVNYAATYGLPYDLIEKGIRIEKDYSTTGLVVIVSSPVLLSVAVDPVELVKRMRSGIRTWDEVPKLRVKAGKSLQEMAKIDAQMRSREPEALEMTRAVVLDLVLDMADGLYSKRMKRALAPRTTVIFEHELDLKDFKRRTALTVSPR